MTTQTGEIPITTISTPRPEPATWWVRALFVLMGVAVWFWTQSLIGSRTFPPGAIGDGVHSLLGGLNNYFLANETAANVLLIVSSAIIDALAIYLLGSSIFGRTVRPFLGLVFLLGMRQICQSLCALPAPEQMIWRHPGFPSALVTYGVSNDLFFSGHTAVAVFGAIELARRRGRTWTVLGIGIAIFEAITVLALRAHYTMDVFTGVVTALWVSTFVGPVAARCDRFVASLFKPRAQSPPANNDKYECTHFN
jgi:hypothetical protein